ncbi:hypothetical protein Agub_g4351, partial [Astrephomene gubernaculifera]
MSRWASALASGRKSLGRGLAFVGAGAVLSSLAVVAARYQAAKAERQLPSEFVLELPLERLRLVDCLSGGPLALLRGDVNQLELPKVVSALRQAAGDERCRGLVAQLGGREQLGGLATVQELRDALLSFRTATAAARGSPAPTAAFSASFGEAGGSGMAPYLLATACERVFMQPSGMLGLTGLESRAFFARGLLERLRVEPHVFAREEYKSAANTLRERGMTEPQRENLGALLGDMAEQMLTAMSSSRGLPLPVLRGAVEAGPLLPAAGLQAGLLDGVKYRDEVQALFPISEKGLQEEREREGSKHKRRKDDPRLPRVSIERYIQLTELSRAAREAGGAGQGGAGWLGGTVFEGLVLALRGRLPDSVSASPASSPSASSPPSGRPKVAVVTCSGTIVQGPLPPGPASNQQVIDASRLVGQLNTLLEDPDVRAVVLRINSPGGSALASDTIHHEVMRLRRAGKPVVVSMGDVAASGGYYISTAADRVLAQPGSLTGSIGVVVGKVNVGRALEDVGVRSEAVTVGRNADLLSPFTGLSPEQQAAVEAMMDHVYDDFLNKVSQGRGRPVSEIRPLAKGRVYTGRQAYDIGLVDELGGLGAAVQAAKRLAGLPEEAAVVEHPPRKVPLLLQLLKKSG